MVAHFPAAGVHLARPAIAGTGESKSISNNAPARPVAAGRRFTVEPCSFTRMAPASQLKTIRVPLTQRSSGCCVRARAPDISRLSFLAKGYRPMSDSSPFKVSPSAVPVQSTQSLQAPRSAFSG